ncbi:MAG: pentapeptide repeat-containing protein, partial [Deltaproteobacteria bacterium]|nr:pentapeptide repeat-containing protein [Deltaproteobacteria bacterium]
LDEIERGERIDISRIYLYAIRRKMERDITSGRTFTSLADKLYFLCELSWAMLSQGKTTLNYQEFPAEISRVFGPRLKGPTDRDYFQFDMMGQNMLIRKDGDYSPAHRSLLEFCAAYKIAAEIGLLANDFTSVAGDQSGVDRSATPEDRTWSQHFLTAGSHLHPLGRFLPEPPENLKKTLGSRPLTPAMRDLLIPMLDRNSAVATLKALIQRSSQDEDPAAAVISGNALTLLIGLDSEAVRGTRFSGARFADLSLTGVDFSGVDFSSAVFERCTLERIVFSRANMKDTSWRNCTVSAANLRAADLCGAKFLDTQYHLSPIFPKVGLNADGIFASAIEDEVALWNVHSSKRTALCSAKYCRSLVFVGRSLLATLEFGGGFQFWDVANPAKTAAFTWPTALADRKFRNLAPIGDSHRVWLLAYESLLAVDLDTGITLAEFETGLDLQKEVTVAPDGVHVAIAGTNIEFWVNANGYTYDPNESDRKKRQISLLAFSPSGLYLAATTERNYAENSDSSVKLYIINTETRSVSPWTSPECRAIGFVSDTLLVCFTTSATLLLLDMVTRKQVLRLETNSGYVPYPAFNSSRTALIYSDSSGVVRIVDTRPFVSKNSKAEPLFPTDPGVSLDGVTLEEETWPDWWRTADVRPTVPENHVPNPRFGASIYSLLIDTRCEGLQLTGVSGLDEKVRNGFIARGAVYQPGVIERLKTWIAR